MRHKFVPSGYDVTRCVSCGEPHSARTHHPEVTPAATCNCGHGFPDAHTRLCPMYVPKPVALEPSSDREWPSKVMVLVYQPLLTCSVWTDYYSRARTKAGLLRHLRKSVKRGEYIGYRLIYDMDETIGVDLNAEAER